MLKLQYRYSTDIHVHVRHTGAFNRGAVKLHVHVHVQPKGKGRQPLLPL